MNKLEKAIHFVILFFSHDDVREMELSEVKERMLHGLAEDPVAQRGLENLKEASYFTYRTFTERELESLINICNNPRIASIIQKLVLAVAEFDSESEVPQDTVEIPSETRFQFEKEWQVFIR